MEVGVVIFCTWFVVKEKLVFVYHLHLECYMYMYMYLLLSYSMYWCICIMLTNHNEGIGVQRAFAILNLVVWALDLSRMQC